MRLQAAIEAAQVHRRSDAGARAAAPPSRRRCRSGTATRSSPTACSSEIIATKVANRFVNRLGIIAPFALTEEEGAAFGQAAAAFVAAERLFGMDELWAATRHGRRARAGPPRSVRPGLDRPPAPHRRPAALHLAGHDAGRDRRAAAARASPSSSAMVDDLLRPEARAEAGSLRAELDEMGAPARDRRPDRPPVRAERRGRPRRARPEARASTRSLLTRAYTKLGEALGLDWAQNAANHFQARDQWERLLTAGLARDFEQLRLEFLERRKGDDPKAAVDKWVAEPGPAHRAVPPHRRPRPHRLGHHRADARPDRDPGAGAARRAS